jgi:hypothetical protein
MTESSEGKQKTYKYMTRCTNCKKVVQFDLPFGKRVSECNIGVEECENCGCYIWDIDNE